MKKILLVLIITGISINSFAENAEESQARAAYAYDQAEQAFENNEQSLDQFINEVNHINQINGTDYKVMHELTPLKGESKSINMHTKTSSAAEMTLDSKSSFGLDAIGFFMARVLTEKQKAAAK